MSNGPSKPPVPSHPFRWFPEIWDSGRRRIRPQARMMCLSLLVGVIAGVGAIVFFAACQFVFHYALDAGAGYHPLTPGGEPPMLAETTTPLRPWLLSDHSDRRRPLQRSRWSSASRPEAEGHGTDAAIAAYHYHQGQIRPRVPLVKIVASALTLGTGGSGGREGPIAQIGAGFGSFLGNCAAAAAGRAAHPDGGRHGSRRRRHLPRAAGRGPLRRRGPLPLARVRVGGHHPRRPGQRHGLLHLRPGLRLGTRCFDSRTTCGHLLTFNDPLRLISYLVLALFMVVLAMLYTRTFYGLTHLFHRCRCRRISSRPSAPS